MQKSLHAPDTNDIISELYFMHVILNIWFGTEESKFHPLAYLKINGMTGRAERRTSQFLKVTLWHHMYERLCTIAHIIIEYNNMLKRSAQY